MLILKNTLNPIRSFRQITFLSIPGREGCGCGGDDVATPAMSPDVLVVCVVVMIQVGCCWWWEPLQVVFVGFPGTVVPQ